MPYIPDAYTDSTPAAAVFGDRLCVAFKDNDSDHILLASTDDLTADSPSWDISEIDGSTPEGSGQVRTSREPALSVNGSRLWLAFKGRNGDSPIHLISMTQEGTWGTRTSVTESQRGLGLAMGGDMVVWSTENGDIRYMLPFTSDGELATVDVPPAVQGAETNVSPAVVYCQKGEQRNYFLAFRYSADMGSIMIARKTDGGSWGEPKGVPGAWSLHRPAIALHKDVLVVAFRSGEDNQIWIGSSQDTDSRDSWTLYGTVPGQYTSEGPALVSFQDKLYVVCKGHNNDLVWYREVPARLYRTGADFSDIPWAQSVSQSKERLEERRRAAIRYCASLPLAPWRTERIDHGDEWEREWGQATESIGFCIAKLWRAFNDPGVEAQEREELIQQVNDYLTSSGEFSGWPELRPERIGTLETYLRPFGELGIGGEDYDFRLRLFTALTFMLGDRFDETLRDEAKVKLLGELLNTDGSDHHTCLISERDMERALCFLTKTLGIARVIDLLPLGIGPLIDLLTSGIGFVVIVSIIRSIIEGDIDETENHILMSETSRYLKNQLIHNGRYQDFMDRNQGNIEYDNERNGFNDWLKGHLQGFLVSGFNEYNSLTYSGFSLAALANLADFAEDPHVRKSARIVLDFISARFATQSFDLKRCVGFCRSRDNRTKKADLWSDPMASWFAVLIGNYAGLQEDYGGVWIWGRQWLLAASITGYRVPDLILDLAIDKSHNPYEIRVNHRRPVGGFYNGFYRQPRAKHPHSGNIEILSARRGYLLTAGGRFSGTDYWWCEPLMRFFPEEIGEYYGWARPTTLIVRRGQRIFEPTFPAQRPPQQPGDYLIYQDIEGLIGSESEHELNNTGVWRNFAVGTSPFHIPHRYLDLTEAGNHDCRFIHLTDSGLYIAVNDRHNFLEVANDDGGLTFQDFKGAVERSAQGLATSAPNMYTTSQGDTIEFDASVPPGRWPIESINGEPQGTGYYDWPFIESLSEPDLNRVLWADGDGKVIVNNPYLQQSLILSLTDWRHPIRIEQGCSARDLTKDAERFYASSGNNTAANAFNGDRTTSWVSRDIDDEWIVVDFGEPKTFNFISLRFPGDRDHGIDRVIVDTSSGDTSGGRLHYLLEIAEQEIGWAQQPGIDIEAGQQTARYVRFRFEPRTSSFGESPESHFEVCDIEIYEYSSMPDIGPDPYEYNSEWQNATRITPGVYRDCTIHERGDTDFYRVDLLAENSIRATVEYDRSVLGGDLNIQLWGWPGGLTTDPPEDSPEPLLAPNREEEIDGDQVKRHVIRVVGSVPSPCLVQVIADDSGVTGPYTLTIQTRGPLDRFIEVYEGTEPMRLRPTDTQAHVVAKAISRGGEWIEGGVLVAREADEDYFVVNVSRSRRLQITVEPADSDRGRPYAAYDGMHTVEEYHHEDYQTLIVSPVFHYSQKSVDIDFRVTGEYYGGYRYDTGRYTLRVELLRPSGDYVMVDYASVDYLCSVTENLEEDLAELYPPLEIKEILAQGLRYVPKPGDPYTMQVVSRSTGQVIKTYEAERNRWTSADSFALTVNYLNEIFR